MFAVEEPDPGMGDEEPGSGVVSTASAVRLVASLVNATEWPSGLKTAPRLLPPASRPSVVTLSKVVFPADRSRRKRFVLPNGRAGLGFGELSGGFFVRSVALLPKTSDRLSGLNSRSVIEPEGSSGLSAEAWPSVETLTSDVVCPARSRT
jgi:hypothetical protein